MDLRRLDYPRHLYRPVTVAEWHWGLRESRIVRDAVECGQAIESGWSLMPILIEPSVPPASPDPILEPVVAPDPEPEPEGVAEPEPEAGPVPEPTPKVRTPRGRPRKAHKTE